MIIKDEPMYLHGRLNAYIIDPAWHGKFPTRLPKNQWPVLYKAFTHHNMIMNAGRLYANKNGYKFEFIAGGTGTRDLNAADTGLQNEVQRFDVTDVVYSLGQVDAFAEIAPGTGNITWQEWGVFMNDATITRGSGTMFSRLLHQYHKNLGDTVLLNYTLLETV